MMKNKGFTLIELVIVLAIIAILMAILIPTFTYLINDARDAKRQSEIRNAYTEYVANYADSTEGIVDKEYLVFGYSDGKYYEDDGNGTYVEVKDFSKDEAKELGTYNGVMIYSTETD